jgi:hypothetical protein
MVTLIMILLQAASLGASILLGAGLSSPGLAAELAGECGVPGAWPGWLAAGTVTRARCCRAAAGQAGWLLAWASDARWSVVHRM